MQRSLFLTIALASAASGPAAAQTPPTVMFRLTGTGADDVVPLLYAQKSGLLRAAGFDAVFERSNSGSAAVAAVVSGAYDIGKSSMGALIAARAHNIDLKIIAGGAIFRSTDQHGQVLLIAAADAPFRTAKDFNGRTLATPSLGDQNVMAARAWLDAHGGDSRTIQFVEVPSSAAAAAVTQGRVAGAILAPPYAASAIADGKLRNVAVVFTAIASRFLETAWYVTADSAVKNREQLLRFGKILSDASVYANAHPAEVADMAAAFSGQTTAAVLQNGTSLLATTAEARDIQPLIDAMARYGMIDRRLNAADFLIA